MVSANSHFLAHAHTLKHLRSPGLWRPPLGERGAIDIGDGCGSMLVENAKNVAMEILQRHQPIELETQTVLELNRIIDCIR